MIAMTAEARDDADEAHVEALRREFFQALAAESTTTATFDGVTETAA